MRFVRSSVASNSRFGSLLRSTSGLGYGRRQSSGDVATATRRRCFGMLLDA